MTRALVLAALLGLTGQAAAQDLHIHGDWVLEGAEGTFYERGVGKPTVAWDGSDYVMFFDTWQAVESPPPGCPGFLGFIGRATSPDGVHWTADPQPVLGPDQVDWARCAVTSPAVVYTGHSWHLFFTARQGDVDPSPSWGDRDLVGVGHATSTDGKSFTIDANPAVEFQDWDDWGWIEHPSVVWYAAPDADHYTWSMWLGRREGDRGDIVLATSDDRGGSWQVHRDPVFSPGMAMWLADGVSSPSVGCEAGMGHPFTMHFGGQSGPARAFGLATSPDGESWFGSSTATLQFPELEAWLGWDAMRAGEDTVVWFAQPDPQGRSRIGLAYTSEGPEWSRASSSNRVCGYLPVDTGDTGDTGPTDSADTGGTGPLWVSGGCGCNRDSNRPEAWIALLGLPLLLPAVRRRRRS